MILKIQLSLVLLAWINKATCASVSKVYFQSGVDSLPLEYQYQYAAPGLPYTSPQISQLSAATPVNSMVPVSSGYIPPCVAPCVYPGPTIASFAPVPSSANLVSYQSPSPSLPIVTSNINESPKYQYGYFVYDPNTGDKKSQNELSDGSLVRGEYSFFQPDGYVREVQYVADDITGRFNAIVTNYLPTEEKTKVEATGEHKSATPCPEVKSETIKQIKSINHAETSKEQNLEVPHENHAESNLQQPQPHPSHGEENKIVTEKLHEGSQGNVLAETHETIPLRNEVISKEVHNTNEGHETKLSTTLKSTETPTDTSIFVPYKDLMKCIESLLNKGTKVQTESPLAYIILNKPC